MTSKNDRAEKIVWLREPKWFTIIIDEPCELGYHCPVCKYEKTNDWMRDDRLQRSEYNGFLWCSVCDKDYPTCLCIPDIDRAIDIYLCCIEEAHVYLSTEKVN